MHGVDSQAARVFMSGPQRKKEFIKEKSGIWTLMGPGFQVDDSRETMYFGWGEDNP